MEILACVKRVPMVGGKIAVTPDGSDVDTRMSGFTVSPHEECAVEEAIRLVEAHGGSVTVLTLGPPEAADQLRDMLALGASRAVLLETEPGVAWGPIATAAAIARAAADAPGGSPFDLLLFGNEAADTCDYQVGVRVAHLLGIPVVTGIKALQVAAGRAIAEREYRGVTERFEVPLPAAVTVKEGLNLPRYPSLPGRMRARKAAITTTTPEWQAEGVSTQALLVPVTDRKQAQVLGHGPAAVPALVSVLESIGVLP